MRFNLACPSCGKDREYARKSGLDVAVQKSTVCFSCRTTRFNKGRIGTKLQSNNPAWKGYKDIPGKVISRARRGAVERGLVFEITLEDVYNVFEQQDRKCALSGLLLEWGKDASIDRIDSSQGYLVTNIQIVHKVLNIMKRDLPNEEFIEWCQKVQRYRDTTKL